MSSLLRLYPRAWRARYGPELEDLVAHRPLGLEYVRPWGILGRLLEPVMDAMLRRAMAANARALTALLRAETGLP